MSVSRPGTLSGSRMSQIATTSSGMRFGPTLAPSGLRTPERYFEVGALSRAARPLADPEHVGGAVDPVTGERVAPGERLFVVEDQRLVACPEVDLVEAGLGVSRSMPQAGHEPQGPIDLAGDALVAAALQGGGDELLVPRVHLGQVGEAAGREHAAQQVERVTALWW